MPEEPRRSSSAGGRASAGDRPSSLTPRRPGVAPRSGTLAAGDRPWRHEATAVIPAVTDTGTGTGTSTEEPEQPPAETRLQRKRRRRRKRATMTAKAAAVVLAALVFIGAGGAWGTKVWFDGKFNEVAALDQDSADIKDTEGQVGDANFLIVGSDTRAGAEPEDNVGSADDIPGARGDAVMLAHVPAARDRAVLVSFPRDLEVTRPECEEYDSEAGEYTGATAPAEERVKLNAVYESGGPRCMTALIQKLSGMRMDHFVGIDFGGFKDMVDSVGGVPVTVDEPVIDDQLGTVIESAGTEQLSGDQALQFVRARKVAGDPTADYGRIQRQQMFLSSLMQKTMSQEVLLDAGKLTGFVNAFADATYGENIGVDQLLTLARSMRDLDADTVEFLTVPTTGVANELGNEELRETEAEELFDALIDDAPIPEDPAAQPSEQPDAGPSGPG